MLELLEMNEEKYLDSYNPADFPGLSVGIDIVVFGVYRKKARTYRDVDKPVLSVLLVKRDEYPHKGKYALPGGFAAPDERLEDAARRVLKSKTGLENVYLEQLAVFDEIDRDPRTRVISAAYIALTSLNTFDEDNHPGFADVSLKGSSFQIEGLNPVTVVPERMPVGSVYRESYTYKDALPGLAFDHDKILLDAFIRIRNKIEYTDVVFGLMPAMFTINMLKSVYEIFLDKDFQASNFRRMFGANIKKTDQLAETAGHNTAYLYTYSPFQRTAADAAYFEVRDRLARRLRRGAFSQDAFGRWDAEAKDNLNLCNGGEMDFDRFYAWLHSTQPLSNEKKIVKG